MGAGPKVAFPYNPIEIFAASNSEMAQVRNSKLFLVLSKKGKVNHISGKSVQ